MTALEAGRFDGGHESTDVVELTSALPNSTTSVSLARVCALLHRLLCFDHLLDNGPETNLINACSTILQPLHHHHCRSILIVLLNRHQIIHLFVCGVRRILPPLSPVPSTGVLSPSGVTSCLVSWKESAGESTIVTICLCVIMWQQHGELRVFCVVSHHTFPSCLLLLPDLSENDTNCTLSR